MKLVLSPEARRDIVEIEDFTEERWGTERAETYVRELYAACIRLTEDPDLGRRRSDVPPPYRVYATGRHLIVYRVGANQTDIEVLNVLHPAMNIASRLCDSLRYRS